MDGKAALTGKPTPGDKLTARATAQVTAQGAARVTAQATAQVTRHVAARAAARAAAHVTAEIAAPVAARAAAQVAAHVTATDKAPHPDKASPAELPRTYLPRPRLDRHWDEWESRRVVVIEAPAGYGKTTLIAANVRRSGRRVLWFTFDSAHAGLPALIAGLDSGISRGEAGGSGEGGGRPEVKPVQALNPTGPSDALAPLIHAIRSTREGWNIVLDDLHGSRAGNGSDAGASSTSAAARKAAGRPRSPGRSTGRADDRSHKGATDHSPVPSPLTSFLDNLIDRIPAGNTLFLASREPVGIRMGKLRLAEQAVRLTGDDLRFTPEETAAFFRAHLTRRTPDPQELECIGATIEGWPAGMAFCLQDLERRSERTAERGSDSGSACASSRSADSGSARTCNGTSDSGSSGTFPKRSPAPDDSPDRAAWSSYFAEEVLATLDPSVVQFVMRASVLPVLAPGLCDDVLGTRDSRALLRDLHRRNLFTFPIAPSGPLASAAPGALSAAAVSAALGAPAALVEPVAPLAAIVRETAGVPRTTAVPRKAAVPRTTAVPRTVAVPRTTAVPRKAARSARASAKAAACDAHAPASAPALETSYRFHPLFQEFLTRRLAATLPDRQVRALRGRAARRLLREGAWAEALVLLTDAGEAASILRLIEKRGLAILHEGHAAILLRAFAAMATLDPRAVAARPRALLVLGSIHEAQGRPDEAEAAFERGLRAIPSDRGRAGRSRTRSSATSRGHPTGPRARSSAGATSSTLIHSSNLPLRLELTTRLMTPKIQRGHHLEAVRLCREALAVRDWKNLRAWTRLTGMLGACLSELGRCDEAEKEFLRAREAYAQGGDAAGEAQVRFLLATCVHHPRGEFGEAEAGIRRAIEYFRGVDDLGICCHCCAILAFLAIEDGDEVNARDLAIETLRQAEGFRLPEVAGLCHLTLGRCALLRARGGGGRSLSQARAGGGAHPSKDARNDIPRPLEDRADAASHFAAALEIAEAIAHTDLNIYPRLGLAEVALDRGDLRLARMHAAAALAHARRRHVRFGMAQACVLLGSIDVASVRAGPAAIEGARASAGAVPHSHVRTRASAGAAARPDPQVRARLWRRAEKILRAMGASWHLHRLLLLRFHVADVAAAQTPALLHELLTGVIRMRHESLLITHERAAGTAALATAFRLDIAREEAAELLLCLGEDAIPELTKGIEDTDPRIRKACADLIARIGGDEARRVLNPHKHPTTAVGQLAIRTYLDSMRRPAPPLRICALGPLRVTIGDRIVSPDGWPSTPAMRVFLFLLVQRFRTVGRDTILEALWPDEPARRARHGFSQAIHILRRVLEPDLSPHEPSSYLRASTEDVRLEPGHGATYDVVQVEEGLATTASPAFPGKESAVTIERLRKTLALYRGDFAEALPDEKCLVDERRKLRNMWLRGASRLLGLLATRRAWSEMIPLADLAITRDASREKFHYHLIAAYYESGNRSAALRAHKRYEKIVYADPLAHLSPPMRELFERIRTS